ncbi:MAG: hypothetical protein V1719_00925 [Patescibacteria group bacterium]
MGLLFPAYRQAGRESNRNGLAEQMGGERMFGYFSRESNRTGLPAQMGDKK